MSTKQTIAQEGTDSGYTYHIEPPEVGGERYARCEGCGRELLTSVGGAAKIPHPDGCERLTGQRSSIANC